MTGSPLNHPSPITAAGPPRNFTVFRNAYWIYCLSQFFPKCKLKTPDFTQHILRFKPGSGLPYSGGRLDSRQGGTVSVSLSGQL